jgi:hypothetical protein
MRLFAPDLAYAAKVDDLGVATLNVWRVELRR